MKTVTAEVKSRHSREGGNPVPNFTSRISGFPIKTFGNDGTGPGYHVIFFTLLVMALSVTPLLAERRGDQGVGVMVGNPTAVTWKMWLDEALAIDAAAGVAQSEFDAHATLLWHNFSWLRRTDDKLLKDISDHGELPFYLGAGPRVLFEHKSEVGVRFPLGLAYLPNETNWEFFGEFAPVLRLTPDEGFDADFALGVRYYFKAIRPRSDK